MDFSSVKTAGVATSEGLLTVTRAAIGFGVGLLVADRLKEPARHRTAIAVLSVGVASALPFLVELVAKRWNRPESERTVKRQLRSIRDDTGMETGAEVV